MSVANDRGRRGSAAPPDRNSQFNQPVTPIGLEIDVSNVAEALELLDSNREVDSTSAASGQGTRSSLTGSRREATGGIHPLFVPSTATWPIPANPATEHNPNTWANNPANTSACAAWNLEIVEWSDTRLPATTLNLDPPISRVTSGTSGV